MSDGSPMPTPIIPSGTMSVLPFQYQQPSDEDIVRTPPPSFQPQSIRPNDEQDQRWSDPQVVATETSVRYRRLHTATQRHLHYLDQSTERLCNTANHSPRSADFEIVPARPILRPTASWHSDSRFSSPIASSLSDEPANIRASSFPLPPVGSAWEDSQSWRPDSSLSYYFNSTQYSESESCGRNSMASGSSSRSRRPQPIRCDSTLSYYAAASPALEGRSLAVAAREEARPPRTCGMKAVMWQLSL